MKNNSLKEIAQKLHEAKSVMLFPHINLDGDALGSCAALCKALRKNGKNAWILLEDDIPKTPKLINLSPEADRLLESFAWKTPTR